jgi:Xaa-Pro aminopeptidase
VKDADEIATMRRAAAITAGAHARAMRYCAQRFRDGCERRDRVRDRGRAAARVPPPRRAEPAYTSIVAAGAERLRAALRRPATRCCSAASCASSDAGCELDGYASDVTAHLPRPTGASARRSASSTRSCSRRRSRPSPSTRPGARQRDAHDAAVRVLAQGMLDCGLLDRQRAGDSER